MLDFTDEISRSEEDMYSPVSDSPILILVVKQEEQEEIESD